MNFGVAIFPTEQTPSPAELGAMAEERGFESLMFPEHTHIPAVRETPWPGGDELPPYYSRTYDPFLALTAAAAATERIRIGTCVCLVIERDPIVTAKEVASIDHLSGGRLLFGVGAGWNREEMRNHGTDPRTRMALMRERVEAMKAIWTQEEASYAGEYVSFERIWSHPKPAQRPHPPVLIGGHGPTVLDRVLAFGDGWLPNYGGDEHFFARLSELQARAERPIEAHILGMPADPHELERVRDAGARRALHWLPAGSRSTVEAALERWEAAIAQLNGE
jgi:probable F420-dependent oxidoreductase